LLTSQTPQTSQTSQTPQTQPIGYMTKINTKEYLWVEKYRPQSIQDLVIPEDMRNKLLSWKRDGEIPHIGLFSNTPGTGKTSISKAILKDLDADAMFINASKENGIDLVRNKIQGFASSVSFDGGVKICVMDEFDGTTSEMQKAFRSSIEEFASNCRFILTGNFKDRIMEAVLNRLSVFDLDNMFHKNKVEIAKQIYFRLCWILTEEGIKYTTDDVKTLVGTFYPSIREMIMVLQQSIVNDELVIDYTHSELNKIYHDIIDNIKGKNYEKCRVLASQVSTPSGFYHYLYNNINKIFEEKSIPQVVVMIQYFMASNTNSRDPEITIAAMCARLMTSIDIKFI
jgi:replication factor C small subunit